MELFKFIYDKRGRGCMPLKASILNSLLIILI